MNDTGNRVRSERRGDCVLVHLSGEVDLSWSQAVRREVLAAVDSGLPVGIDLAGVGYMDSSGIAVLIEGFQRARSLGRRFVLLAVSPAVRAVLELARLDQVFVLVADAGQVPVGS